MPKPESLNHGSTVVVTKNKAEYMFVMSWAVENGKTFGDLNWSCHYPFCLSVHGKVVGWTCEMDRALYYMPFLEFLKRIGYRLKF